MTLLKMSFYGAVIILAIILIRAFTLHKLPKKTFLILWGVALLRLLVPFEIASGFSLYSLLPEGTGVPEEADVYIPDPDNPLEPFEKYADYLKENNSTQIADDDIIIVEPDIGGAIYLPNETPDVEAVPLPNTDPDAQMANDTAEPGPLPSDTGTNGIDNIIPFLPVIWGVGTLLCAAFFLISYIRCYREFRTSLPVTEDYAVEWLKQHPLKRTISIRQSDKISAPLTYGIFRPVILMPKKTDWNNFTQLDYVLYHEFTHIRRFDLAAKLVMIVALCLHWFNPFVWAMYFFFNRDLELSCDDCVVKHFKESKADYANTLIGMEEKKNYSMPLCNHFSKNAIEERITAIMKSKKTTIGMVITAVVIVVIVIVTLTTDRKATVETPEDSDTDLSVMMEYEEVLTARIDEYLTMMNSCFLSNPPISGVAVPENSVSINDNTGLYPVDEEAFPSYDALIGYVKSICSEKHADELCRRYWLLENYPNPRLLPNIGVLDGKAYTKLFNSTPYPESFEITDIKESNETTLSATFRFTEGTNPYYWGVLTFAKQEDTWYVTDVTIHRHPMDVSPTPTTSPDDYPSDLPPTKAADPEPSATPVPQATEQQFIDLFYTYNNMFREFFDSNLETNHHSYTPSEEVTINGVDFYVKVTDERFPTLQSVVDYMETICTPEHAEELRNEYWQMNSDYPTLAELDGELYTQLYYSTSWILTDTYRFTDMEYTAPDTITLTFQGYLNTMLNVVAEGTMTFQYTDGGWRVASKDKSGDDHSYFDAYNGEKLQIIECTEPGFDSPALCNDIIFYRADEGETREEVLIAMKTAILEPLTVPSEDRSFTVTSYDVTVEQPYQQIGISAWRLPILTGYYAYEGTDLVTMEVRLKEGDVDAEGRVPFLAQGSEEAFHFILLETEQDNVYRLQREEAANAMIEGTLSYDWVYNEELMTPPDTTTPDWYAAVEEIQHGRTPADTTVAERSFGSNSDKLQTIQPSNENGHVFTISYMELWKEKNVVLRDVSLDLSGYTTDFIWKENGIYYDEERGFVYVVFSPSDYEAEGAVGMADYQILLATIPDVKPASYTIKCYGNPETPLDLGGSYTYGTTKIDNLIYLGESCHGDSFYAIDIDTMELRSLSYVNDALHAQAKSYLEQCGLGTEFATDNRVVCKTGNHTIYSADISYSFDNSPTYFTVYHAYDGEELVGKVILRHRIPFYDANESRVNAMYYNLDDVVRVANREFEAFYASKGYDRPYKITSIHMTSFESIEVEFLISESDNFDIYTEAEVKFTHDFTTETWSVSYFRETPPDYLSSHADFPRLAPEEVTLSGKDWCLTYIDEIELPRFQELASAGGTVTAEPSDYINVGHWYTISLDGISYFFYRENAPEDNDSSTAIAVTSPDYPLSGGAKVGMTAEELLTLYPNLAKTNLTVEDPVFEATYGPSMYGFRDDQFPPAFLKEYDYAYLALTEKPYPGLPICVAFLIKDGAVAAITEYMPTAN